MYCPNIVNTICAFLRKPLNIMKQDRFNTVLIIYVALLEIFAFITTWISILNFYYLFVSIIYLLGVSAFKPVFPEKKTTVVADLFKPLTLRCHARAEPIPLYEWSRNNTIASGQTKIKDGVIVKSNHVTLTLCNVTWSDRGSYFCNAWNSKGYEFKEYEVIVNGE